MNTGDGLHQASIAVTQTVAVNRLHSGNVGAAVMCDRYAGISCDNAGHTG